jgi:sterol desaturase/sphingolipid hydroxylase (fatty acid hydroxylase superfamily)
MELTVAAIPFYFGSIGAEYAWLKRHAPERGATPGDYEWHDTIASLTMGVGSLVAPLVAQKLLGPVTPGRGRYAKALLAVAAGAVTVTALADAMARGGEPDAESNAESNAERNLQSGDRPLGSQARPDDAARDDASLNRAERRRLARKTAGSAAVAAVVAGGIAVTTSWASFTTAEKLWAKRGRRHVGTGPAALAAAILVWDFIYYWNHRFMHESRYMWAIHVVHHSSERYNLSTALRQPVADALGTFLPQGVLCLAGFQPSLISSARGINLIYQFWIHTEAIGKLGPLEKLLNTPSHHRVHHGVNPQYIDRNHGSILILWDRLFGTFEPEGERVVYGLTRNIKTFNPLRIAAHEHREMLSDVWHSRGWRERLSYVVRGPDWAYRHREQPAVLESAAAPAAA